MALTNEQIKQLVNMIVTVSPDDLDCDSCTQQIAEFADHHLRGKTLEESQLAVKQHLENCHCCEIEFKNLLEALENAEQD